MFSQVCVILFTEGGGCLPQCMLGYHTPQSRPPGSRHPPEADTPNSRHPPKSRQPQEQTWPPGADPPGSRPPREQTPPGADPPGADPPSRHPPKGPHPRGKLRGIRSRPTPKGEIEGDQIQAHTQGGNWGGSDPGPHARGKLRGIRSRPTPKGKIEVIRSRPASKGEIEGDQIQHPPSPRACWRYSQRAGVRILLECNLVTNDNGWNMRLPSVAQNAHGVIF